LSFSLFQATYTVEFTDGWEIFVAKLTDVGASSASHLAILNNPVGVTNRFYRLLTQAPLKRNQLAEVLTPPGVQTTRTL
jgi:hypothetical protein